MTQDGWKQVIRHANANEHSLDLLSRLLAEQDLAKNRLSSVYGCTGMPWPELVDNIMDASRKDGLVAWLSK